MRNHRDTFYCGNSPFCLREVPHPDFQWWNDIVKHPKEFALDASAICTFWNLTELLVLSARFVRKQGTNETYSETIYFYVFLFLRLHWFIQMAALSHPGHDNWKTRMACSEERSSYLTQILRFSGKCYIFIMVIWLGLIFATILLPNY